MTVTLQERYQQERTKRLNSKGLGQYLDASKSAQYTLGEDPWVANGTPVQRPVPEGGHVKIAVFGAGIGGITAAARSLTEGSANSPDDILIVDPAGGFGGTWYHNRYPGLMCDVESYLYLPLLEEIGYMPKRKYAAGEEIRQHLESVADKYGFQSRAMFQTSGKAATWDSQANVWNCEVLGQPKGGESFTLKFSADYIILCSGGFTAPKIPDVPGMDQFQGDMLHTGRWRYDITGGSPENPVLDNLAHKRVALVGTGATAVQAVPATAKYAKELYVFQRTASAVDYRGNRDTDPEEWKTISGKKGWQFARGENFQTHTEGGDVLPEEDLVNDGMSKMPTLSGAWGGSKNVKVEEVAAYLEIMNGLDGTRSDRVRQRAMEIVKDPETAKALQAWYPGWCKRPTFHDDYLVSFNQPNVHLVDTAGKGIEALTADGIRQNGKEYPVDLIIWSTGYGSPLSESLAGKAGIKVTGRNGLDMESQFKQAKLMTLHGLSSSSFPNAWVLGFSQAGVGVNQTQRIDEQSLHIAYTIREAERRRGGNTQQKVVIEPTQAACDQWGDLCASFAHKLSTMSGCTPSYFNGEGESDRMTPEQQAGAARCAIWGQGYMDYARRLQEWRAKGGLEGIEVEVV